VLLSIPLFFGTRTYSRRAMWVSLLLSPYLVMPATGLACAGIGYWTGSATFADWSPAPANFGEYHPRYGTRAEWSGGDLFLPAVYLYSLPNNGLLLLQCSIFGPVRGNYHGIMPTADAARQLIASAGQTVPYSVLTGANLAVGSRSIRLTPAALARCREMTERRDPLPPVRYIADSAQPFETALFATDCLVVLTHASNGGSFITLVDARSGRFIGQECDRCK
jgi:hypothetical protein